MTTETVADARPGLEGSARPVDGAEPQQGFMVVLGAVLPRRLFSRLARTLYVNRALPRRSGSQLPRLSGSMPAG